MSGIFFRSGPEAGSCPDCDHYRIGCWAVSWFCACLRDKEIDVCRGKILFLFGRMTGNGFVAEEPLFLGGAMFDKFTHPVILVRLCVIVLT